MRADVEILRRAFRGAVITAADAGYEDARALFNRDIRTRPAVLCRCACVDDVVRAVRFARDADLPIAVRGGGHHAAGFCLVDGGLVVDLGGMRDVAVDPVAATAVVAAGAGWRDVDRVSYVDHNGTTPDGIPFGYAVPGGECPTVSNAGYSLGGGCGLLGRRFGLGCDHIVAAEPVDAHGRVLSVTEDEHPDLLWALRGAGGAGFGAVTRLTYRLAKTVSRRWPSRCASRGRPAPPRRSAVRCRDHRDTWRLVRRASTAAAQDGGLGAVGQFADRADGQDDGGLVSRSWSLVVVIGATGLQDLGAPRAQREPRPGCGN